MRTERPERLKAFDYLGLHRYFLTFCTFRRRHHFATKSRVDLVSTQILRAATGERFAIIADCFMPDHVHLLVEGQDDASDGRQFIALAKQFSGFHFKKQFGEPLWQRYGYERVLRDDEATLSVVRYIVENPLRAGLVQKVSDYPFIGSSVYSLAQVLEAVQLPTPWKSG